MNRFLVCFLVLVSVLAACTRTGNDVRERPDHVSTPPVNSTAAPVTGSLDSSRLAQGKPFDSPALAQGKPRIVFLGDSLSAGYGLANKEQSVPSLIQKQLDAEGYNYEVVNHGVSGDTSAGGVSRLEWALNGDVRVLVIELGGNDGLRGLPVETTKRNISQIITTAKQRGVRVLLTGMEAPPSYGPLYTSQFRQVFRDLAREHAVAFMPFFLEGVAGNPALNQPDGIHPNPEGAVIVERAVWTSLQPLLQGATR